MALPVFALFVGFSDPRVMPSEARQDSIQDMRGVAVPVVAPASRVLIFPPVLAAYLTVDASTQHLAAAVAYQKTEIQQGLLHYVFPEAARLPDAATLGRDTAIPGNPEQVMALGADAIFSWWQFSAVLTRIGAPVVRLDIKRTRDEQGREALWRLLGSIAGRPDRVARLIDRYHGERDRVLSSVAPAQRHPRALYVFDPHLLLVAFGGTLEDGLLQAVGAVNVAARLSGADLGKEQLLRLDPDIIILAGYSQGNTVRALCDDPALHGLAAVRARRVYRQPFGGAGMEGLVEEPLMLQWLAEIVHPDLAPPRFRHDIKAAYATVYGVTLSDDAIDATLRLDENAGAAGFERFRRPTPSSPREKD